MGKYDPLRRYLESHAGDSVPTSMAQIERVLGFALPASAYKYYAWWANETSGSHSHAKSWQDAGWQTRDVDLGNKSVRFERIIRDVAAPEPANRLREASLKGFNAQLARASQILRIDDHHEIMRIALETLIRDTVTSELIGLGGTMPDLQVPERERPVL